MAYSETGNSIRMLLAALMRGKWLFASVLLATFLVVTIYIVLTPRVYRAASTLVIEPDGSNDPMAGFALGQGDRDILVELQILESMDLATRVVDELDDFRTGEDDELYPLLDEFQATEQGRLMMAKRLRKTIEIDQIRRDVGVVEVAYRSQSPAEAQLVTNLYASQYAARNLESSRVQASGLRAFVEAQLVEHQSKLNDVEQQLAVYQESENAFALDEEARRLSQQMADLQTLLDQANVEYEMVSAQLASLDLEYRKIEPNLAARVSAAGLEKEISTLQEEVAQLEFDIERKYAKNPSLYGNESTDRNLLNLIAQAEALKEQVRRKANRYVDGVMSSGGVDPTRANTDSAIPSALTYVSSLRRSITDKKIEAAALQARVTVLTRRLRKYETDFDRIPAQARTIAALQRDRGSSEQTYSWLTEKYEEARIAEESEFGNVKILDAAYLPTEPVSPRSLYALLFGGLMGLILAVSAVFVKELLDDSILAPEGVRRLGVTLLGIVPRIRPTKSSSGNPNELMAIHAPSSRFATSIQHLVTRLDALESGDCSVVLVTSPESGEGKTTIASNVAAGLATAGWRTLLLDANLWSPRLHSVTNTPLSPGLTDLLFGPALMKDCIHSTSIANLSVISAGGQRSGKFTLLASRDFDALMTYLKASFDRIVIDAAGLHSAGSSLGLTPLCDQLVVVARAGKTSDAELSECLAEMKELSIPDLAVVLNSFDSRLAFGSYSGRRFFGEYGKREGTRWWTSVDQGKRVSENLRSSADSTSGHLDDPNLQKSGTSVRRRRRRYRESISAAGASPTRKPVGTDFEPPLWEDSDV